MKKAHVYRGTSRPLRSTCCNLKKVKQTIGQQAARVIHERKRCKTYKLKHKNKAPNKNKKIPDKKCWK